MVSILLIAMVTILLVYLWQKFKRPYNYPPGPPWYPLMGNLTLLKSLSGKLGAQHLALSHLSEEYRTPVLGLKLGTELVVVVSTYEQVHKVFTREEFEGRPDNFFIRLRSMGTRKGVTCTDGEFWKEQRSFVVRHLRQLGYGKMQMEEKIIAELNELLVLLRKEQSDGGVSIGQCLAPSVLNVLWALTAGNRFSRDDQRLKHLLELLAKRGKAFNMAGGTLSQLPWLRFIAPERIGYNLLCRINKDLRKLLLESIDQHKSLYQENVTNDLIDAFLHEMKGAQSDKTSFTEDQLIMICLDLFIAGSQTTSNTLDFAFLMMVLNPQVQNRVYNELDTVLAKDKLPELADQGRLPYTEAVLMEVQRLYQVTPIAGPRRVLRDTKLLDYDIPKESTILINLWSIHMDKDHWGDPENFRPERFLDEAGLLKSDEWLLPFGLGRRRCLGEVLAKSCIFLFFAGIVQHFHVASIPGKSLPSTLPNAGITLSAKPYKALLIPRLSNSTH